MHTLVLRNLHVAQAMLGFPVLTILTSRSDNSICVLQSTLEDQHCRFLELGHGSGVKHQIMLVEMNYAY